MSELKTTETYGTITTYSDEIFDRMFKKLSARGFKRISMVEFIYIFPDQERWIKVVAHGTQYVSVNFNDETEVYASPYNVLAGLDIFNAD